jgi:8-oxo-dGTP diphosphatase
MWGSLMIKKPFHHLARGILIQNNKVLLAHAIGHKNTFLPGGHIEFGESAKDALVREIDEELGIKCEVESFLGLVEHKWEKKGVINYEINQAFVVKSNELKTSFVPESQESHIEFLWCDVSSKEFNNLQPYPFRKLIEQYINGNKSIWWESTLDLEIDTANRN